MKKRQQHPVILKNVKKKLNEFGSFPATLLVSPWIYSPKGPKPLKFPTRSRKITCIEIVDHKFTNVFLQISHVLCCQTVNL